MTNEVYYPMDLTLLDLVDLGRMFAIVRSQIDYDVFVQEDLGDLRNLTAHQQVAETLYLLCNTILGSRQLTQ